MAALDISEAKFSIGVDTPIPTATVFIHGDDEGSTELSASECRSFADALLKAAIVLEG